MSLAVQKTQKQQRIPLWLWLLSPLWIPMAFGLLYAMLLVIYIARSLDRRPYTITLSFCDGFVSSTAVVKPRAAFLLRPFIALKKLIDEPMFPMARCPSPL